MTADHMTSLRYLVDRLHIRRRRMAESASYPTRVYSTATLSPPFPDSPDSRCSSESNVFVQDGQLCHNFLSPTGQQKSPNFMRKKSDTQEIVRKVYRKDRVSTAGNDASNHTNNSHTGSFHSELEFTFDFAHNKATIDTVTERISLNLTANNADHLAECSPKVRREGPKVSPRRPLLHSKSVPISPPLVTPERTSRMWQDTHRKLGMLAADLVGLRMADEALAKKFLDIYSEIQTLRMRRSCVTHCALLDEAYYSAEVADEVPDVCDAAPKSINKLLHSKGVTSFNISNRRFSCS
ncbi:uncharacterized protein LOC127877498 [Dreissena polymorpha]|uniref:Uncharacterized protein n=1 Tax=Dreissena polymorpha TaxID=45954 RepID=A0A9D4K9W2_DREPO|nr:uncharacterized protein LOC127877498 [Dreissena polymorpha]KAH3835668.1 hypothetical protein DPMN_109026 [Dreissena polymorpha]